MFSNGRLEAKLDVLSSFEQISILYKQLRLQQGSNLAPAPSLEKYNQYFTSNTKIKFES